MTAEFIFPIDQVLTAADRCDRCPARAWVGVLVSIENRFSLLFCAHHFLKHSDKIIDTAAFVVDERFRMPS